MLPVILLEKNRWEIYFKRDADKLRYQDLFFLAKKKARKNK
jgi:hypothetical protein